MAGYHFHYARTRLNNEGGVEVIGEGRPCGMEWCPDWLPPAPEPVSAECEFPACLPAQLGLKHWHQK